MGADDANITPLRSISDTKPDVGCPKDHPGRTCATCGLKPYIFWVDSTPPPGTCPHKADWAGECPNFRSHMVNAMQMCEMEKREPRAQTLALLARNGLDWSWAKLQQSRFLAFHEAATALRWGSIIAGGAELTINGQSIRDWCAGEFSVERLAAIIAHVKGEFDPWRGKEPGELSWAELEEERLACEHLCENAWPEWDSGE